MESARNQMVFLDLVKQNENIRVKINVCSDK